MSEEYVEEELVLTKGMERLETFGKAGKVGRTTNIMNVNLNSLKENADTLPLRITAYLVKGLFLLFKRNYELFAKDVDSFIEIYIQGKKKKTTYMHRQPKELPVAPDQNNQIQSLALFNNSENELASYLNKPLEIEKFLHDKNQANIPSASKFLSK